MTKISGFEQRTGLKPSVVADCLRANSARLEKRRAAAAAANTFQVGQSVRSIRRIGAEFLNGTIAEVEGSTIVLESGRRFSASAFAAV